MSGKHKLLLILLIIFSVEAFGQTQNKTLNQLFAEGNYTACIASCDKVFKTQPNDKNASFFKGASMVKLKKYEGAKKHLMDAEKNGYQPQIAINANLLRVHAGLQETQSVNDLLQKLAKNGFRALSVLNEAEFEYLSDDDTFNTLKLKVDANANPCKYGEEYKRLDFWIGEWDVYVNGSKIGTSSITKSEGGCTLYEDYKTASGFLGRSTNYYNPTDKLYTQIWIDKFNSITEFKELESKDGYLQMAATDKGDGNLTRMTYVQDPINGNVTQTMEASTDNGKTWASNFVGVYKKRKARDKVDEEKALKVLIDKLDQALIDRNYKVLNQYYGDQINLVAPNGMALTKEMALAPFKDSSKKSMLKEISNENIQITIQGNSAFVLMETTHSFKNAERRRYKNIQVFEKGKEDWYLELVTSIALPNQ